jgi:hypothetical protein
MCTMIRNLENKTKKNYENIERVLNLMSSDRHWTIKITAQALSMTKESIRKYWWNIRTREVCGPRWCPKFCHTIQQWKQSTSALALSKELQKDRTFWTTLSLLMSRGYSNTTSKLKDKSSSGQRTRFPDRRKREWHAPKLRKRWVRFADIQVSWATNIFQGGNAQPIIIRRCYGALKTKNAP